LYPCVELKLVPKRARCIVARRTLQRAATLQTTRCLTTKFSKDHEWITVTDGVGTIGITNFAQDQLGDVVFVDLPELGSTVEKDDTMGAVESVKAASDIYSPVSGEVVAVNEALVDEPALVNTSAEADGWMAKVKLSDESELDGLMDEAGYKEFCAE